METEPFQHRGIKGRIVREISRPLASRREWMLLIVLTFVILFARYVPAWNAIWDFDVYLDASKSMLEGRSPYVPEDASTPDKPYIGLPYLYSPLFARLVTPLTLMDPMWSGFVWVILKCVCLLVCVLLVVRLIGVPFTIGSGGAVLFLILFYQPIGLDMGSGNVAIFEITVILGGLKAWRVGRPTLGGFLLVLPLIVKPTCLLLLLYPLHRRAWKVLRGAALGMSVLAVCMLPDIKYVLDFFRFVTSPIWASFWDELAQSFYNFSAITVVNRIFGETYFVDPIISIPWLPAVLAPLAPVLILTCAAWAIARSEKRRIHSELDPEILSLVLLTAILLPPRLAGYTLAWTFFSVVALIKMTAERKDYLTGLLTLLGFTLVQLDIEPQHVSPGISQLLIDHYFFGLLFLFCANLRAVTSSPRQKETSSTH